MIIEQHLVRCFDILRGIYICNKDAGVPRLVPHGKDVGIGTQHIGNASVLKGVELVAVREA